MWGARTRENLAAVTVDLPPAWLSTQSERREAGAERRVARETARAALRRQLVSYAFVMTLLVGVWLAVGVSSGAWYPWPVWPALGWGIALLHHVREAYGRPREAYGRPRAAAGGCRVR